MTFAVKNSNLGESLTVGGAKQVQLRSNKSNLIKNLFQVSNVPEKHISGTQGAGYSMTNKRQRL